MKFSRSAGWLVFGPLAIATALGACGDDDDTPAPPPSATSAPATAAAFCEPAFAFLSVPAPADLPPDATPEQVAEAIKAHASESMLPLVPDLRDTAPEELAGEVETLASYAEGGAETGEFQDSAEVAAALEAVGAFGVSDCGWNEQRVSATEYAFDGLAATLQAGPTVFHLANEGEEIHAMTIARKNDGVTLTTEEILSLPDDEAFEHVTIVADFGALPGETGSEAVDLPAGSYIVVCMVPVGLTGPDVAPDPAAPPHAAEGMLAEVTVE